jgi:hypothetical protein
MMPNKTLEIRELYQQQNPPYLQNQLKAYQSQPVLNWPADGYFNRFEPDSKLLQDSLKPETHQYDNIADKIFGGQKKQNLLKLKHSGNLFYERCNLHNNHIKEIDNTITDLSGKLFSAGLGNFPDGEKRQSSLENQMLQLEHQRREEQLSFWKDTVDLRKDLFENAAEYKTADNRYRLLTGMENNYGRNYQ